MGIITASTIIDSVYLTATGDEMDKWKKFKQIFDANEIRREAFLTEGMLSHLISALCELLADQNKAVRDCAIARAEDLVESRRRMIDAENHAKWLEQKESDIAELYQLQLVRNAELQSALDHCRTECAALQAAVDATGEHVALSERFFPDEYGDE